MKDIKESSRYLIGEANHCLDRICGVGYEGHFIKEAVSGITKIDLELWKLDVGN